jgi:hypothetical protein
MMWTLSVRTRFAGLVLLACLSLVINIALGSDSSKAAGTQHVQMASLVGQAGAKTGDQPNAPSPKHVHAEERLAVLQTPGLVGFVGIRGLGLPIPDKEIEDIQTLLAQSITCALYPFIRMGQRIRIRGGCLDGVEGILVAKNSDRSLVVSIELIQRSVAVRIDGYDVETI